MLNAFTRFRIILTNAVKYVTNVESYDRRIQSANNIRGRKMQRKAEVFFCDGGSGDALRRSPFARFGG